MRTRLSLAAAVLGAALAGPPAAAAAVIAASTTERGSLQVNSLVRVAGGRSEHLGGWSNVGAPCSLSRRLAVVAELRYEAAGTPVIVRRTSTGPAPNCVEGGVSSGPAPFVATRIGLGCRDRSWRPGRYTFTTITEHVLSGVRAVATLVWDNTRRC